MTDLIYALIFSAVYIAGIRIAFIRNEKIFRFKFSNDASLYYGFWLIVVPAVLLLYPSLFLSYEVVTGCLISAALVQTVNVKKLITPLGAYVAWLSVLILSITSGYTGIALSTLPFILNAVVTQIGKEKRKEAEKIHKKSGTRDVVQIVANVLPTVILSVFYFSGMGSAFLIGAGASMAGAFSDSMASDMGVLSKKQPVDICTLKKIKRGLSGGISFLGTVFSVAGSFIVAAVFYIFTPFNFYGFLIIGAVGFLSSLLDSVLGSKLQIAYRCVSCGEITEKQTHCNKPTLKHKGFLFFNNDIVNLICGVLSGFSAVGLAFLI